MNMDTLQAALDQVDVFSLMGMSGTEAEKETFLAQMQQTVWSRVLEDNILPTLPDEDMQILENLMADESHTDEESQGRVFEHILKVTPNLPELMKAKILEFKGELLIARLDGLRDRYMEDPSKLDQLDTIEQSINAGDLVGGLQALSAL